MNKNYIDGFNKIAHDYGVNPEMLMKVAEVLNSSSPSLKKQAGYGALARLITKMSPKVDPSKLNWFTKLFTTTRSNPVKMTLAKRLEQAASGTAGTYGSMSDAPVGKILNELAANSSRTTTRVSPEKILGTVGAMGTMADIIRKLHKKEKNNSEPNREVSAVESTDLFSGLTDQQKKYLILGALGVGTLGIGAAGGALLR